MSLPVAIELYYILGSRMLHVAEVLANLVSLFVIGRYPKTPYPVDIYLAQWFACIIFQTHS
eukprot:SAG11_NODE_1142_length_5707_cov_5.863766_1_plen_61_part_00